MKPCKIIEHIVLFKIKPNAETSAVKAMVSNLNGLTSLDPVLHLTAGPLARTRSSSSLTFTHMLHSRYGSLPDLTSYTEHPAHVSAVVNYVTPVIDDIMAVDWVSDFTGSITVQPGSAVRVTLLKLKEGLGESVKNEVLRVLEGIRYEFPSIEQLNVGENFSHGRAKGFSIASLAVLKGMSELEAVNWESDLAKVREFLDDEVVLDYVVRSAQSATL
ncbi:Stress responsive alpha-beta barrel domain protein [Abeliophyllum distichum]|uniref:Stress responsive alpha-beta barrel domain protein n=1 Tax=Abeliophyllum distichum TaxID=126358 RepID=A0ABD1QWU6_9LAMI